MKPVPAGKSLPEDFNVIIEIPAMSATPIKYEFDKDSNMLVVDRFMGTCMQYPANYGFIPQTLSEDGDPVDVLVVSPYPLLPGSYIRARAIGVLEMTDESGVDAKLIAVPHQKLTPLYDHVEEVKDLPELLTQQIQHFFQNYKALEKGKWVKVDGYASKARAHEIIAASVAQFADA